MEGTPLAPLYAQGTQDYLDKMDQDALVQARTPQQPGLLDLIDYAQNKQYYDQQNQLAGVGAAVGALKVKALSPEFQSLIQNDISNFQSDILYSKSPFWLVLENRKTAGLGRPFKTYVIYKNGITNATSVAIIGESLGLEYAKQRVDKLAEGK